MLRRMGDSCLVTRLHETICGIGTISFLTEFCAGGTIAEKVEREGPLPSSIAAKVLATLAEFAELCIAKGAVLPHRPHQCCVAKYRNGICIVLC